MAFLGIKINSDVGRMLNGIDVPGVKESPSEYHITILCFDDNWPISKVSKALEATYEIVNKEKPFYIEVNTIDSFPKRKDKPLPIIARVESKELHDLCDKLREKFDDEGIDYKKDFKEFKPHITLSYDEDLKSFEEVKIDPVTFTVQDIVLWGGDYGDSRLFVNFQLKAPDKRAELFDKINLFCKTAKISHYNYDITTVNNFLNNHNGDEDSIQKEFNQYGGYGNYYFDIIPISNIENTEIWSQDKFDTILNKMKENIAIDPVRLSYKDDNNYTIIDGIHRIAASKSLGYDYIPAFINKWITTLPQTKKSLFDKINMFYKLSFIDPDGYLTPTRERHEKDR